jgi:hypothetical protein
MNAFLATGSPEKGIQSRPTVGESRPGRHADYDRALTTRDEEESTMAKKSRKKKARKKNAANHGKRPNS